MVGCGLWGELRGGKRVRGVPAMGGKRMAIRPRKMSLLHMMF